MGDASPYGYDHQPSGSLGPVHCAAFERISVKPINLLTISRTKESRLCTLEYVIYE